MGTQTHPENRLICPSSVLQRLRIKMGVPRELMPSATREDTFTSAANCRRPPRGLQHQTLGCEQAARPHLLGHVSATLPSPSHVLRVLRRD